MINELATTAVPRRPRHHTEQPTLVTLEPLGDLDAPILCGELLDLSRQGVCVRLVLQPRNGALYTFRLQIAEQKFSAPASVQWSKADQTEHFTAGLHFIDIELPYEVLGELFLLGVLESD